MIARLIQWFPVWAIFCSGLAYVCPSWFVGVKPAIVPLLATIMLTMGLTLTPQDFLNITRHKTAIVVGAVLQFSIMPMLALAVSWLLDFNRDFTVGMVLVGCVAGGTASNVMTYLAKGDVALSISMTAFSTLLGVVLTPLLTELLIGHSVAVPVVDMLISLLKIVVVPVTLGVVLNVWFAERLARARPILPLISMLAIVLIIATIIALNADLVAAHGAVITMAVMLHNVLGLTLAYNVCRLLRLETKVCRTIAFEVGLQNSGVATALAMNFFTPVAAVPGTIFSIWHNISGSALAAYWSKTPPEPTRVTAK